MSDGEDGVAQLQIGELGEEVRLVLDRVLGCTQPDATLTVLDGSGIVTRGHTVVKMTYLRIEGTELDETVAHHVGIGRQTLLHALDGITHYLLPVLLL